MQIQILDWDFMKYLFHLECTQQTFLVHEQLSVRYLRTQEPESLDIANDKCKEQRRTDLCCTLAVSEAILYTGSFRGHSLFEVHGYYHTGYYRHIWTSPQPL